jgi:hypothetical protein
VKVKAVLNEKVYAKGRRVSEAEMKTLNLERHEVCPEWNYTIRPRLANACIRTRIGKLILNGRLV